MKPQYTCTCICYDFSITILTPYAGVSTKAGYRQSAAACRTSYRRLFDFINENKNDINEKKQIQQQQRPLKLLNATKLQKQHAF